MATDLEKFLQQAAERLAQKAGNRGAAPARPSQSLPSSRPTSRLPSNTEIVNAEVVDTGSRFGNLREAGPDPLSTIDTRPGLAQEISQTDERMLDHVHQVFDHQLSNLKAASSSLSGPPTTPQYRAESPLLEMLRSPATLRQAFIASEIFKRK